MNEKQELYNLVAENINAGITTSSDQEIHATARHLRGAAERLNFELNKR